MIRDLILKNWFIFEVISLQMTENYFLILDVEICVCVLFWVVNSEGAQNTERSGYNRTLSCLLMYVNRVSYYLQPLRRNGTYTEL